MVACSVAADCVKYCLAPSSLWPSSLAKHIPCDGKVFGPVLVTSVVGICPCAIGAFLDHARRKRGVAKKKQKTLGPGNLVVWNLRRL